MRALRPEDQLPLLSDSPIARTADPETSKKAAAEVTKDGTRAQQQNLVLGAVKIWPNLTSAELAKKAGWSRFMPARRLPELRNQGLVENGEARPCNVTGKTSMVWRLRGVQE